MTQKDIEPSAEALQAASKVAALAHAYPPASYDTWIEQIAFALDRFRAAGVREERERCALLAEKRGLPPYSSRGYNTETAASIARAIRSGASPHD